MPPFLQAGITYIDRDQFNQVPHTRSPPYPIQGLTVPSAPTSPNRPTSRPRTSILLLTGALGVVGITLVAGMTGTDTSHDAMDALPTPPRTAPPYLLAETGPDGPDDHADPLDELDTTVDVEDWERLADCESGQWDRDGDPKPDSARWDYGVDFDHGDHFQGGLNFHPATWDAYRDPDMPAHAGRAEQVEEIVVAERVLDDQGWDAWPVCSEKMDLAV